MSRNGGKKEKAGSASPSKPQQPEQPQQPQQEHAHTTKPPARSIETPCLIMAALSLLSLVGLVVGLFVAGPLALQQHVVEAVADAARKVRPHAFEQPKHASGVKVVDLARHDLPPVRVGERVVDLMSGIHFDNLLQDTPDEMRPPSVILFTGFETCPDADAKFKFRKTAETVLPSRERLLLAVYDMDASPHRSWFKFTPEMDLAARFGVTKCGVLVYVPRACDGYTTWCTEPTSDPLVTRVGCDGYVDRCAPLVKKYDAARDGADWTKWVLANVNQEGEPEISPVLGSYADQARWILERDETTTDNEARNYYLAEAFPAFTPTGFLALPMPDEFRKWIMDFWNSRKRNRVTESWHSASTQMSFHEVPTSFVSLDQIAFQRDEIANRVIKPMVEKWSGIPDLELTSFYGIREYKGGNSLRNHIDRIDTHVLSVTFTLGKVNSSNPDQLLTPEQVVAEPKWPLEVISYDGTIYRHEHPPNVAIFYESSKLCHGRPYKNPGPGHLGAFLHFKPRNMHAEAAAEWDAIAKYARDHQFASTRRGSFRTTPVVEPKKPVFTKHRYADKTGFESSKGDAVEKKRRLAGAFQITAQNEADATLDLAWVNPDTSDLQVVGTLAPGTSIQIESFLGHKFQWLEHGTKKKKPQGKFEVEAGSRVYRYVAKADAKA